MSERPPVTDWFTDWDHLDPAWTEDPYAIWDQIRQSDCPVVRTGRYNGAYLPTTYADIRNIAYDPEHFSSRRVVLREVYADHDGGAPPITNDPPKHRKGRMVLMPPFSPHEVRKLEPRTREICNELIDEFPDDDVFDGAADYARHIPVRVIAHMLGVPDSDADQFRKWIQEILIDGITDDQALFRGMAAISQYFEGHVATRRAKPGDDIVSYLLEQKYEDGEPFKDTHIVGTLRLLLVAGIDTTWSAIGASLWHLARHPADRERLIKEPDLMPQAVEELLRAYAPVTMAREVAKDTVVNGCPMKAGEMLLLAFPAANRDPAMFTRPDEVDFDRDTTRSAAFGLGIHRCVGMYLARMELITALQVLLERIPSFDVAGEVTWSRGPIRGPRELPLRRLPG